MGEEVNEILLPEGLEEDDESVDAVGDRLTAFTLCSLVVSANTATSWGICLPCLPFNSSCVLTSNKEVAGWSAPVRVATGNNSNRSYEFIFREFKMLKGETVRNVVSLSRFDLYSSVTPETGRTFDFVSPLFSATSFSTCTGKIPLLWLRNLLRRFNFSLRRTFCGLSSVTSLTLSAAFVVDEVMFFKIVFAGGGLEAGNCGLFGNLTIGLTKDTASDVSTGLSWQASR